MPVVVTTGVWSTAVTVTAREAGTLVFVPSLAVNATVRVALLGVTAVSV